MNDYSVPELPSCLTYLPYVEPTRSHRNHNNSYDTIVVNNTFTCPISETRTPFSPVLLLSEMS